MPGGSRALFFTVIVPVKDEGSKIRACLEGLLRQLWPSSFYEVIVVDNGSRDNTLDVVKAYPVRVISAPDVSIAAVRNAGAALASGDVIAFLDGDCVPDPDWLDRAAQNMHGNVVLGGKCVAPADSTFVDKTWMRLREQARGEVAVLGAANLFIPTPLFQALGGFDESLATFEDDDLCRRARKMGAKVCFEPDLRVVHLGGPRSCRDLFKRALWHSTSFLEARHSGRGQKAFLRTLMFLAAVLMLVVGAALAVIRKSVVPAVPGAGSLVFLTGMWMAPHGLRGRPLRELAIMPLLYFPDAAGRAAALLLLCLGRRRFSRWRS